MLFERFSLNEMLGFCLQKYPFLHPMLVYKNLSYFLDAERQEVPHMFVEAAWEEAKQKMKKQIENL